MSRSNAPSRNRRRPPPRSSVAGFTLMEVMVSSLIFGTVSIAVMSAFLFLGTSMTRMSYAQQLEENSRRAFYLFNQDVGKATKVTPDSSAPNGKLVLTLPVTLTTDIPAHTVTHTVTYEYISASTKVTRTKVDTDTTTTVATTTVADVLKNLTAFDFDYFNNSGTAITVPQSASISYKPIKSVQFSFTASLGSTTSTGASIYRTSTQFQTVSPIVFMRNTATNDLLP